MIKSIQMLNCIIYCIIGNNYYGELIKEGEENIKNINEIPIAYFFRNKLLKMVFIYRFVYPNWKIQNYIMYINVFNKN